MPQALSYTKNIRCKNMDLNDLIKLAGIQNAQAPVQEQPVASSSDGMRTMIALVTPEQLNQLTGDAPVAEEMPGEATTEPNPQAYQGTLGSASDLSLRRYLGANGEHVTVDETNVYEDHKVEDITEAWNAYKVDPVDEATKGCSDCEYMKDETDGEIDTCDECAAEERAKARKADESINEGGMGNIHAMISNADDPAEMVMDLVDKGDAIGNYLYGELEQLAIEAGKTFNNAESMPEDFVDELLYNMGIEESIVDENQRPPRIPQFLQMLRVSLEDAMKNGGYYVDISNGVIQVDSDTPANFKNSQTTGEDEPPIFRDEKTAEIVLSLMSRDNNTDEAKVEEDDIDENAFNQAAAAASRAGKDSFEFGGKTHKTTMKKDTAHKLDDDIDVLKQLAGL